MADPATEPLLEREREETEGAGAGAERRASRRKSVWEDWEDPDDTAGLLDEDKPGPGHEAITRPLLRALAGHRPEARRAAAAALAALTGSHEGRAQLRGAGGLGACVDLLTGGAALPADTLEPLCAALANLCDDDGDDWRTLAQAGGVFSLCAALGASAPAVQEALLTLLALLCAHAECRDQAADAGAMPALCRLVGSNKPAVARCALAVCQQLCGSRRACGASCSRISRSPSRWRPWARAPRCSACTARRSRGCRFCRGTRARSRSSRSR